MLWPELVVSVTVAATLTGVPSPSNAWIVVGNGTPAIAVSGTSTVNDATIVAAIAASDVVGAVAAAAAGDHQLGNAR
jgi:hypothetical protein